MTYFNPEIYNEDALNERDKGELNFWRGIFEGAIGYAEDNCVEFEPTTTKEKLEKDVFDEIVEYIKDGFEMSVVSQFIVGCVDNYPDEEGEE